jgi:hypothetical protein
MRPIHVVSLVAVGVLILGILGGLGCNASPSPARAQPPVQAQEPAQAEGSDPAAAVVEDGTARWTVRGAGQTRDDAKEMALKEAHQKVVEYLARQNPPIEWRPTADYVVSARLVKEERSEKKDSPTLGLTYWSILDVQLGPKAFRDILEMDRQARVLQREILVAKVLAVLVSIFTAVALYFRLDEATKGYYSGWLMFAGLALVGAVSAGVWLVSYRI